MLDPLDFQNRPLITRLSRKRTVAGLVLMLESGSAALWRIVSWLALFAGLWLLQAPAVFGGFGPAVAWFVFAGGLACLLWRDIPKLRRPSKKDIDRRLEQDSTLPHRPLNALQDKLVNPKTEPTRKLWQKNREEALKTIGALHLPLPRALLAARDPAALRTFAALVLVMGLFAAGPQWHSRLASGLFPFTFKTGAQKAPDLTLWITPPDYTGKPQVTLQGRGKREEALDIPAGSIIKVRVNDGFIQPSLVMGLKEEKLEKLGDRSWGIETEIQPGEHLKIRQWPLTRADIAYKYVPDAAPTIEMTGDAKTLTKGELQLPIKVSDDYGVTDLTVKMDLDPMIEDKPMGTPFSETRAVMSPPGEAQELSPVYDLAWHPWAGLPVVITLQATDHPGQKSKPLTLKMTLPERVFNDPLARQIIALRKRLIWTPKASAANVSYELENLLADPSMEDEDIRVFLALRSASSRLAYDESLKAVASVVELLWDTALRVEEGDLPLAFRNMRNAQRALENLLKSPNATDEQIAKGMQDLREAMGQYLQEMYREMQKRMAENGGKQMQIPPEMFKNMIDTNDIASFLDQLQAEALSGDRDAARQMLSQLQKFMDGFDPSMDMGMPPQMQFMMKGISELQQLIEKQQALLDQTQKQADKLGGPSQEYPDFKPFDRQTLDEWKFGDMPPPPQENPQQQQDQPAPQVDTRANKTEQDALRYILGQLMLEADQKLGEIPENMQHAELDMRSSGDNLGKNRPDLAVPDQQKAIQHLQDAMNQMSKQMQQMMKQMMVMSFGSAQGMDPLGRPMRNGNGNPLFPGSKVKIPDEGERKRVQEILKTLRQRSGEINRPDYELEYYRRLMKQF